LRSVEVILLKSVEYLLVLLAIAAVAGVALYFVVGPAMLLDSLTNFMFLETALTFIAGGAMDMSQSHEATGMRKLLGNREASYSAEKHKEYQKKGVSYVLAAIWMILAAAAVSMA